MGSVQLTVALVLLVCRSVFGSEDRIQQLERVSKQLARQLMLQQLYVEEQSRSGGDSGLKQVTIIIIVMIAIVIVMTVITIIMVITTPSSLSSSSSIFPSPLS